MPCRDVGSHVAAMNEIELQVASAADRSVLENLFQLYIHDFSEHWSGTAKGELGDDGRFEPYPLDVYWRDEGAVPLLLRRAGLLVGFALVNRAGHLGLALDRNLAEFFIARKHRRAGLGQAAAAAIFIRYPGQWETAVARRNVGALTFWRRAIATHPRVRDLEEHDVTPPAWNGAVIRFRIV